MDGTGAARYQADVGVANGRIVTIDPTRKLSESAPHIIDATDLIVAPGFIDPHTHYDAQVCWDPLISCSSWNGGDECGDGKLRGWDSPRGLPEKREMLAWDLVNVEGMSFEVLSKGVTWEWESLADFMAAPFQTGMGINLGFFGSAVAPAILCHRGRCSRTGSHA